MTTRPTVEEASTMFPRVCPLAVAHPHRSNDPTIPETTGDRTSPSAWGTLTIGEFPHSEEEPACGNSNCNLLSTDKKLEHLLSERETAKIQSGTETSSSKQSAFGKRRSPSIKQSPEAVRRMTPLRQMSSLSDTESEGKDDKKEVGVILCAENFETAFHSNLEDTEKPTSIAHLSTGQSSSSQNSSTPTSPKTSMSQVRSVLHKFPAGPARFRSQSACCDKSTSQSPISTRKISAPSMASTTADPTSRSRFQSWPRSYSPGRASPCPPATRQTAAQFGDVNHPADQKCNTADGEKNEDNGGEDRSRWSSDSEDDDKRLLLRLSRMPPKKPRDLRRRLSDWLCGS
ncbi:MAG: hypothetical protein Q9163_002369 [Psora crenata]